MSQDRSNDNSFKTNQTPNQTMDKFDTTQFFVGTPSKEEMINYFLIQKRKNDLKMLETTPDIESSPELSESFEMYLQQRKQKISDEKLKLAAASRGYKESPRTTRTAPLREMTLNETLQGPDDTLMQCTEDSFLAMEKMCENTLHLNNVSENLIDLTALDASMVNLRKSLKKPPSFDETHLDSVEAPSFMFNNTTLASPLKHSPLIVSNVNRPSTIMEVSEISASNRTNMTSYQTAYTRNGTTSTTATSSEYRTANEGSFGDEENSVGGSSEVHEISEVDVSSETEENKEADENYTVEASMVIAMPKIRSFYSDYNEVEDLTKDSLEETRENRDRRMTRDSLEPGSYVSQSSSGVDSSYDQRNDSDAAGGDNMNDTLEQIEFMLAQAQKMQEQKTPGFVPASPMTPYMNKAQSNLKPRVVSTHSPLMKKLTVPKASPLITFSPVVRKTPLKTPVGSAFKRPINSATKVAPTSASTSKKFQYVESPISRYIKDTPGAPLSATVRSYHGIGKSPKQFNFRDSETFCKENESMNATTSKGSSLPCVAKTKSSAKTQVFDQRDAKKTPGGKKIHNLLAYSSPTVTKHQGHIQTQERPKNAQNCLFNETAMSEQSFADLSLVPGDVSVQVVETVKRSKK